MNIGDQVLNVNQMLKLKELGATVELASIAIYSVYAGGHIFASNGSFPEKQEYDRFGYGIHNIIVFDRKPVFTIADIIQMLPDKIYNFNFNDSEFCLSIDKETVLYRNGKNQMLQQNGLNVSHGMSLGDLKENLYNMLIWVLENKLCNIKNCVIK